MKAEWARKNCLTWESKYGKVRAEGEDARESVTVRGFWEEKEPEATGAEHFASWGRGNEDRAGRLESDLKVPTKAEKIKRCRKELTWYDRMVEVQSRVKMGSVLFEGPSDPRTDRRH